MKISINVSDVFRFITNRDFRESCGSCYRMFRLSYIWKKDTSMKHLVFIQEKMLYKKLDKNS